MSGVARELAARPLELGRTLVRGRLPKRTGATRSDPVKEAGA